MVYPLLDDLPTSLRASDYRLAIEDCTSEPSVITIKTTSGVLSGLTGSNKSHPVRYDCRWRIVVPQGRYIVMVADMLGHQGPCAGRCFVSIRYRHGRSSFIYTMRCLRSISKSPVFFFPSNTADIVCKTPELKKDQMPTVLPQIRIEFTSTKERLWTQMTPAMTSMKSGFVTPPGFDVTRSYGPFLDAWCNVTIPCTACSDGELHLLGSFTSRPMVCCIWSS